MTRRTPILNLRDLRLRARAVFARRRVERDLDDELAFHIEREAQQLIDRGATPPDALAAARARFGSVLRAADECRDARGIAAIDTFSRDLRYAVRMLVRAPLVSITVIATVGLGLGLVAAAFTFLNVFLFRVDAVPAVHEMFEVRRLSATDSHTQSFTRAQFDAIVRDTRVFSGVYAEVGDIDSHVEGRTMTGSLVTGNVFGVLRVRPAMGRAIEPGDDRPGGGAVMVLSHRGWERMFAGDPGVLGRHVRVNGLTFQIVGVMPDGFRGLSVGGPDYWAPLSLLPDMLPAHRGHEDGAPVAVIGRLRADMTSQGARGALAAWDASQRSTTAGPPAPSDVVLTPRRGTVPQPLEAVMITAPLFFAFGLILLTGCANVANLLLARGVTRQREIGIRLSIGATRRRVVRQLLTESLLLALGGALTGYLVSRLVLKGIVTAVMTSMPANIGDVRLLVPDADWRVVIFLVVGAAASTVFFGLAPALQATRIEPVRTIRGEIVRDARPGRARNVLIGLQVGASALLLICAGVFLRSTYSAATENPGVRIADSVVISIASEPTRAAIVEAVAAEPRVSAVAAAWPDVLATSKPVVAEVGGVRTTLSHRFVSPEYFGVLDIPLVRGRSFMSSERSATFAVAVVSESAARALWPNADAVGEVLRLDREAQGDTGAPDGPALDTRTFTVVGVVKDVRGFRIAPLDTPVVYLPTNPDTPGTALVARVQGDPERATETLTTKLAEIDPNMATSGQVSSLVWITRMVAYFMRLAFWLTVVLGGLALVLTVSGLFGVLSYLVERRAKEIGIRMALGAAARDVTRLVLWQTIKPVAFGLSCGALAAAGVAAALLATPAASGLADAIRVLDPLAYVGAVVVIVVACLIAASIPASRAARLDPTRALRQE
jgi:predicted permease